MDPLNNRGENSRLAKNAKLVREFDPASEGWSNERAEDLAQRALRWLAQSYPECGGAASLDIYLDAVDTAAQAEDMPAYVWAMRSFVRAGKREALRIRALKNRAGVRDRVMVN